MQSTSDTIVIEEYFHMTLPGTWSRVFNKAEHRWNFLSHTGKEQITVSMTFDKRGTLGQPQPNVLENIINIRRATEAKACPNPVELSETVTVRNGQILCARYEGIENNKDSLRRFSCMLMSNGTMIAIFYFEAVGIAHDEFQHRGRTAFNSIVIPVGKPKRTLFDRIGEFFRLL